MRLAYVVADDLEHPTNVGIKKKVIGQTKAFASCGFEAYLVAVQGRRVTAWAPTAGEIHALCEFATGKLGGPLKRRKRKFRAIWQLVAKLNPEVVYIRWTLAEPAFLQFLRQARNTAAAVILEFPTYPYAGESIGLKGLCALLVDRLFASRFRELCDVATCYSDHSVIHGIPTVRIQNGIDLDGLPINTPAEGDVLRLVGIANLSFWTGYDRVIRGISEYIRDRRRPGSRREVVFHVVGQGPDLQRLQHLVRERRLENHVFFHGLKTGRELDEIVRGCHVGVASLGVHRSGHFRVSSLKAREFCARGIPFVLGYDDPDFASDFPYAHRVPADDSPVNIPDIINFYESVSIDASFPARMRAYAEQHLSWVAKLSPIVGWITNRCKIVSSGPWERRVSGA